MASRSRSASTSAASSRIPYETPKIEGVELNFDLVPDRRSARLETARTDVTEARPGDEITIETLLRPYRGESILRQIPVKIPTSTPKGTLRILISDGDTLDKMHRVSPTMSRRLDLGSTIALLNKEHTNSQVYVSLLEANPQAMVDDKVMPTLPLSVMNVMDGMRGTQDMIVVGESVGGRSLHAGGLRRVRLAGHHAEYQVELLRLSSCALRSYNQRRNRESLPPRLNRPSLPFVRQNDYNDYRDLSVIGGLE